LSCLTSNPNRTSTASSLPVSSGVAPGSSAPSEHGIRKPLAILAVLLTVTFLVITAVMPGWKQIETDFPNYYTAAVLARQGQPLRDYYDWTWFARQMNYAGIEGRIGNYTPQSPLTMLPMLPLAAFPAQRAKQIWLLCNLLFLGLTLWLLHRLSRFGIVEIWLLAFGAFFSLRTNFLYGQYYVLLLFLLTLAFYFLHRKKYFLGGLITAIAFALKLYGGPFLLYFIARRHWKALIAMILATFVLAGAAIALFGFSDVHYYATQILPRSLEGAAIDPYDPGIPTLSNLLHRLFLREPELNPHPLWESPWAFFFLRTFISLLIALPLFLQTSLKPSSDCYDFAWFMIASLLLSTNLSSYTFLLLLLPLLLLLEDSEPDSWRTFFLVGSYVLLAFPLHPLWLFPKVWLLVALYLFVGWPQLRRISPRFALAILLFAALAAFFDASRRVTDYAAEPGRHFPRLVVENGAVLSSFPAISSAGVFYQSMGRDRYVLRWLHDNTNEELSFHGHALQPRLAPDGVAIDFELVANRHSTMMRFDPATRAATPLASAVPPDVSQSSLSPDGKWLAYESSQDGPVHIWLRNLSTGRDARLTGGNCNSSSPAWELNSRAIVFADDCDRAFGLPALYRAPVQPQ
jgi:Glycosyltransferase family 87/WD40-like Beta Propeller Repeat